MRVLSMEEAACMSGHGADQAFSVFSVLLPDCGTGRLSYRFPCQDLLDDSSRYISQPLAMAGHVGCGVSSLCKLLSSPQKYPETRVPKTLVAHFTIERGPSVGKRLSGWLSSSGNGECPTEGRISDHGPAQFEDRDINLKLTALLG